MNIGIHADIPMIGMLFLTLTNVPPQTWSAAITEQRRVIGRSKKADIALPAGFPYVSRRHAELWREPRRGYLCDIGSRAGTQVNGLWVEPHRAVHIQAGDRVWLGGAELQVVDQLPATTLDVAESDSLPAFSLDGSPRLKTTPLPGRALLAMLSPAEHEVVMCICRGHFDDKEIGRELHRSPHTVRTQVGSILRKLNLHARNQIIGFVKKSSESDDTPSHPT